MYDTERKRRFLEEYCTNVGSRTLAAGLFKATEKYEEELGKDICTWGKDELTSILGNIIGVRSVSQATRLNSLGHYIDWCIVEGFPNAKNELDKIEGFHDDKMYNQMVATPKQLQTILNYICDPEEMETVDLTFRCYCWLGFAGIKEKDIFDVKRKHVNLDQKKVSFDGMEFSIHEEAIQTFRLCSELDSFFWNHPNNKKGSRLYRTDGVSILRGVGEERGLQQMRVGLSTRMSKKKYLPRDGDVPYQDAKIAYGRLNLSGIFYETYKAESQGFLIGFRSAAERFVEDKQYSLTKKYTIESKIGALERNYTIDYIRWKEVFKKELSEM